HPLAKRPEPGRGEHHAGNVDFRLRAVERIVLRNVPQCAAEKGARHRARQGHDVETRTANWPVLLLFAPATSFEPRNSRGAPGGTTNCCLLPVPVRPSPMKNT